MKNVFSMPGGSAGGGNKSVWCIPALPGGIKNCAPIKMLVMSKAGPRYIPTDIIPPFTICGARVTSVALMEKLKIWEYKRLANLGLTAS